MNGTVPEEVGKVATTTIEAVKSNPSCLAAIVLAAMFAVLTYLALQDQAARDNDRAMEMIKRCFPLQPSYSSGGSTEGERR